jgi:hypothetical protein
MNTPFYRLRKAAAKVSALAPDGVATSPSSGAFPRIADYAFIPDCHTGALVASDGAVERLCLPRFDSPSAFGALLDREAGSLRLGPRMRVPLARRYLPGSHVLDELGERMPGAPTTVFGEMRAQRGVPTRRSDGPTIPGP